MRQRTEDAKFGSPATGPVTRKNLAPECATVQTNEYRASIMNSAERDGRRETGLMRDGRAGLEDRHGET